MRVAKRTSDAIVNGDAAASFVALPLDVLHRLKEAEPEAFLVLARLIAIGSPSMPHLCVAADEWESLSLSANRQCMPLPLRASHMAALKQAQLSLASAAHTIESHLADLAEQGRLTARGEESPSAHGSPPLDRRSSGATEAPPSVAEDR